MKNVAATSGQRVSLGAVLLAAGRVREGGWTGGDTELNFCCRPPEAISARAATPAPLKMDRFAAATGMERVRMRRIQESFPHARRKCRETRILLRPAGGADSSGSRFLSIARPQASGYAAGLAGGFMHRTLWLGIAILSSLAPLAVGAQQSSFSVGTASATPGQKATGYLEVPAGADPGTSIPVVVVNGAKPGKVLALVSGAHGTEYVSIIAIEKLSGELDPARIAGTVILVPLVNIPSFDEKVPHVHPVDGKSMNRFYPGKEDGTQTERASHLITKEIVDRCDYLIDYHGGDLDESLRPYAYW